MNRYPIRMLWKESSWSSSKEVFVYDFMHETIETFQSFALCWVPSSSAWVTISVAFLEPVINTSKILNEGE